MLSSLELEWLFFTVKRHGYFLSPHGVPGKHPCDVDLVIDWKQHPMVYRYMYMYTCFVPITCDIYIYIHALHICTSHICIYTFYINELVYMIYTAVAPIAATAVAPHTPALHSTLYTSHVTLYTYTPHFTLYTLHSTFCTPHFKQYTWHCTL